MESSIPAPAAVLFAVLGILNLTTTEAKPKEKITARVHAVAKGEIRLILGDETLGFKDAQNGAKYIDAITQTYSFKAGDIVFVKMRSTAVCRQLVMAFTSKDGSHSIPVRRSDYHYLGEDIDYKQLSREEVSALNSRLEVGSGDPEMNAMWREHALPESVRKKSQWIKLPSKGVWHTFALKITPEMLNR
jgi:hypothetical protein